MAKRDVKSLHRVGLVRIIGLAAGKLGKLVGEFRHVLDGHWIVGRARGLHQSMD
jgi:hypothetical protein